MATNYNTCVTQIANITAISSNTLVNGDANFGPIFPAAIDYAEQRIFRELDLSQNIVGANVTLVSSGQLSWTPTTGTGTFLVIEQVLVYTPAGTTTAVTPLIRVSRDFIFSVYGANTSSNTGQPQFWALNTGGGAQTPGVIFGPATDQAYNFSATGTIRPTPLSANNSSTILTQMLPDLFNAAMMVFMAGQMRDFGSQSDNPQMGQSWENQYQLLFKSAQAEEVRKKYESQGWTQYASPLAIPPRA